MDDQLTLLATLLRGQGLHLTQARRIIWQALVESGGHVSADELTALVRRRDPRIGRMTVYRTLSLLSELGLARPVYQGTGAAHYVLLRQGSHHHLVCSSCDQVIEFDDCMAGELESALAQRFDFQVEGHLLELYGLCQTCQKQ